MSTFAIAPETASIPTISTIDAVAHEARIGLTSTPKTLSPWLFYDEAGSHLFEQITELPEYYLTRTERSIFTAHADEIIALALAQAPRHWMKPQSPTPSSPSSNSAPAPPPRPESSSPPPSASREASSTNP